METGAKRILGARLILAVGLLASSAQPGGGQETGLLDLPMVERQGWKSVALSNILGEVGSSVRGGYVLFALEETLDNGKEPTISLHEVRPGMTLGDSLREILPQLPDYEMEIVSDHLIGLRPFKAKQDPDNILNLRVASFDMVSKPAYAILDGPHVVIPELKQTLAPKPGPGEQVIELYFGGYHGGPPITLHLKNVTVREILNAAAVASEPFAPSQKPRGWFYAFDPDPPEGPPRHSWKSFLSLPADWSLRQKPEHSSDNP